MSGKRSKILRHIFEQQNGFSEIHRGLSAYRAVWRKFKSSRRRLG